MKTPEYVIKPSGNITSAMKGSCTEELEKISALKPNVVILDFAEVNFIDSSAISCILRLAKKCKELNCFFAVLHCNSIVKTLLYNLNLNKEFPID